jgi:hypothetical protein
MPELCPAPCLPMSVENRTRGEASDDSRDVVGRDAFSIADVRAAGVALVELWGCSMVYGAWAFSVALRVAGDSSSSSCGAECRRRMPPVGGSPAPDMVGHHLSHRSKGTETAIAAVLASCSWPRRWFLAACRDFKRLRGTLLGTQN